MARGAASLASRRRGRSSGRRLPDATRDRAVTLVRARYADFGPTFAHQKLTEEHALAFSVETLRGWMIAGDLWVPRTQRARRGYPPRVRRACPGELIQIDRSDHAWFEDRGPRCTLLVYIDDATSRLMELCFAASESTFDYFRATQRYLARHGKPSVNFIDKTPAHEDANAKPLYAAGLAGADAVAKARFEKPFVELTPEQQDEILAALEAGTAAGWPHPKTPSPQFFEAVRGHTIIGFLADPKYGGNRSYTGWTVIGYPGGGHHLGGYSPAQMIGMEKIKTAWGGRGVARGHRAQRDRRRAVAA